MRLDSSTFPVVKIFFDAPSEGAPEDAFLTFERLLAREQPFLLLHEKAVDENNHEHAHEERKRASIWMKKNNKDMLVKYMAVRDKNKKYLGTMEIVQDMDFARKHFEEEGQNN